MSLLKELNSSYIELHEQKENAFWAQMMGLNGTVEGDFEKKEIALRTFCSDPIHLIKIREALDNLSIQGDDRVGLEGWKRFFEVNVIEKQEARDISALLVNLEGKLDRARRSMALGYTDPETGKHVTAGSVALALKIVTAENEGIRKAAWEGLAAIEPFVLENGFLEIVRQRNKLAHLLGYQDYYDYKVTVNEGFGKETLFRLLDELEENTREACKKSLDALVAEHGAGAIEPWNMGFHTSGDITTLTDPYYRFDTALGCWGRSFAALGITYANATMRLDLVDRKGKYENGFMHGPYPTYMEEGIRHPARINFTANAVPGQVGSGKRALHTLLHEGGHAAHFSNIAMPAPCFSQEFAPTSVAFAETQSMFLDSLLNDPDWLTRYALNEAGESMPFDLMKRMLETENKYRAHGLRRMLAVSYAEKALYEMTEEELTPENVLQTLREIEQKLLFQPAASRPLLSIPHLLSGEASAYYHGYTLAQMAVYQTRAFFLKRDGYIMDNPNVGKDLAEHYWKPGNSKTFLEFIKDLTGEPFSAKATVELVNKPLEQVYAEAEQAIEKARDIPHYTGPIELQATISVVHGDEIIAAMETGDSFNDLNEKFGAWILQEEERRAVEAV